ncbi:MAG: aspartate/glutamate racemase family protein [Alphaproteobacteria bacterium]
MNAAVAAFDQDWPEARTSNILDDGLFSWVNETGGVVPEMFDAFHRLTAYAVDRGADGIVFSCSAFRECIDSCATTFDRPILGPNEAMIEAALEAGPRIGVLATVAPTIPSISAEIEEKARQTGRNVTSAPVMSNTPLMPWRRATARSMTGWLRMRPQRSPMST